MKTIVYAVALLSLLPMEPLKADDNQLECRAPEGAAPGLITFLQGKNRGQCVSGRETAVNRGLEITRGLTSNGVTRAASALEQGELDRATAVAGIDCNSLCNTRSQASIDAEAAESGRRNREFTEGIDAQGTGRYSNAGRPNVDFNPQSSCVPNLGIESTEECNPVQLCTGGNSDCEDYTVTYSGGSHVFKRFKPIGTSVDFTNVRACSSYLRTGTASSEGDIPTLQSVMSGAAQFKSRICRLVSSSCELPERLTANDIADAERKAGLYRTCIKNFAGNPGKRLHQVVTGVGKCIAILDAGESTTEFQSGPASASLDGRVQCKRHAGEAFDYPSCTAFVAWYNSLVAAQTGVQLYNEGDKVTTGMRAQNRLAAESQNGNVQALGVEAARASTMAAANGEERNKIFFAAKGAAITAQLVSFTTPGNIEGKCSTSCCRLFAADGQDAVGNDATYFPNQGMKAAMIAEVIRAGGEAALAAMKQAELERQAAAMRAAEEQILAAGDESEEGIMRFCQQYPLDAKCLSAGNRVPLSGTAFNGPGFSGQNFGLGTLDQAADANVNTESGSELGAAPSAGDAVAAIGDMNKEAAAAKNEFDKPSALRGGGGTPTFSPQTGAGASASANGLSRDPGAEGEKKENPLKITSKNVNYDGGGATYAGGGWRPGSEKKEDAAANPFASMFGKDKGRDPAAAKEIDAPASDLFTKISNRYQEVQKRKALMDVR